MGPCTNCPDKRVHSGASIIPLILNYNHHCYQSLMSNFPLILKREKVISLIIYLNWKFTIWFLIISKNMCKLFSVFLRTCNVFKTSQMFLSQSSFAISSVTRMDASRLLYNRLKLGSIYAKNCIWLDEFIDIRFLLFILFACLLQLPKE